MMYGSLVYNYCLHFTGELLLDGKIAQWNEIVPDRLKYRIGFITGYVFDGI